MFTKLDVANWKTDPVTKAFYNALEEREVEALNALAVNREIDDEWYKGYIAAIRDIHNTTIEGSDE